MNDLFATDAGRTLISLLVFASVGLAVHLLVARRTGKPLAPSLEPYAAGTPRTKAEPAQIILGETSLSQRGIELTTRLARPSRLLALVEQQLRTADVPLRAAEGLFFYLAGVTVLTLLCAVATRRPGLTLAVLGTGAVAPYLGLKIAVARRQKTFAQQSPDTFRMLAGSLRSGRSLLQGFTGAAQEVDEPMRGELASVLAQVRLGRPIEDALDEMAERMASRDWQIAVSAMRMQRQMGGNLAELLEKAAETIVARTRFRQEVKALTAEGRISAIVVGILPPVMALVMYAIEPSYIGTLFHDPLGRAMVAGAAALVLVGFFWMRKTLEIEV